MPDSDITAESQSTGLARLIRHEITWSGMFPASAE